MKIGIFAFLQGCRIKFGMTVIVILTEVRIFSLLQRCRPDNYRGKFGMTKPRHSDAYRNLCLFAEMLK